MMISRCVKSANGGEKTSVLETTEQDLNFHSYTAATHYTEIRFLDRAEIKCPEGTTLGNGKYRMRYNEPYKGQTLIARPSNHWYWKFRYECIKPNLSTETAVAATVASGPEAGPYPPESDPPSDDDAAPSVPASGGDATPSAPASGGNAVSIAATGVAALLGIFMVMFFVV
jgi:hypothetical protein